MHVTYDFRRDSERKFYVKDLLTPIHRRVTEGALQMPRQVFIAMN